jgi:hypothetical protein
MLVTVVFSSSLAAATAPAETSDKLVTAKSFFPPVTVEASELSFVDCETARPAPNVKLPVKKRELLFIGV